MASSVERIIATNARDTSVTIGKNFNQAQDNLLTAYSLSESTPGKDAKIKELASKLGVSQTDATVRSLQLIAEQRFQSASHTINLFSTLLDKVDQLKQRIINRLAN